MAPRNTNPDQIPSLTPVQMPIQMPIQNRGLSRTQNRDLRRLQEAITNGDVTIRWIHTSPNEAEFTLRAEQPEWSAVIEAGAPVFALALQQSMTSVGNP